jgi:hypothetical protein
MTTPRPDGDELLARILRTSRPWAGVWTRLSRELEGLPLRRAHERVVRAAEGVLPFRVAEAQP